MNMALLTFPEGIILEVIRGIRKGKGESRVNGKKFLRVLYKTLHC